MRQSPGVNAPGVGYILGQPQGAAIYIGPVVGGQKLLLCRSGEMIKNEEQKQVGDLYKYNGSSSSRISNLASVAACGEDVGLKRSGKLR